MPSNPAVAPLAAALLLALSLPAHASLDGATAADDAGHSRKPKELPAVEVIGQRDQGYAAKRSSTATKTDTPLLDTPQAITVVSQALIRDQAMQGMADVVRYVPGIGMAQGEGNRDAPVFRGNASTADLFIDGMRDDVQYFRDLYNIDRVEALKGPSAMIFGRGGSGGVLNRVSKKPDWTSTRDIGLQWASWGRLRATADFNQAISEHAAVRVTALAEDGDGFRDGFEARRRGANPVVAWRSNAGTALSLGFEHFEEQRTADRGIPSLHGRPVDVDPSTFFGDPRRSVAEVDVDALNLIVEHDFASGTRLRNQTRLADYNKYYQNVYPGSVQSGNRVAINAYNDETTRRNLINQTDITHVATLGTVTHTLLAGMEVGRQETGNLRRLGFFPSNLCPTSTTSASCVPLADPIYTGPIEFRQTASSADNHSVARTVAFYLQDQMELTDHWQVIVGLRHDEMRTELLNRRNGQELESSDNLISPRVGLVYKPIDAVSLYGNYSVAFLPRSGEQLTSLAANNAALEPEKFNNLEFGAKWDFAAGLSATAAVYSLERSNVAVVDPTDPTRLVLLAGDGQRVRGVELGLSGQVSERWSVMGGYAYQDGEILADLRTSATAVLPAGTVLAQLPRHSFSFWNRFDLGERWGLGLGVVSRSSMFASTSNAVTLPGFARYDGAVFYRVSDQLRVQLNIENLFDKRYAASAHNDNNISPGSPRAFNLGINLAF